MKETSKEKIYSLYHTNPEFSKVAIDAFRIGYNTFYFNGDWFNTSLVSELVNEVSGE